MKQMNCGTESLPRCVLEEIALEGLDGITIEGLWKRLGIRLKLSLPLKAKLTDAIWNYMKSVECLSYYLLPEPREPLKIYDRADCIDPKTGAPTEPVNEIDSIKLRRNRLNFFFPNSGRMSVQRIQI